MDIDTGPYRRSGVMISLCVALIITLFFERKFRTQRKPMNPRERTDDRPRVASFLIDDILAPPSIRMGQCCNQNLPSADTDFRQLSSPTRNTSFLCNQSVYSTFLPCYGSQCYMIQHPCYWNAPYTCYAPGPHGYNFHGNPSLCSTQDFLNNEASSGNSLTPSETFVETVYGQTRPRRPRRPWTRAVFSNLQRKGLEKRFQVQKYLTKADRHQLASMLGLSDSQVKVWFQNRRMKWRQEARESVTSSNTGPED